MRHFIEAFLQFSLQSFALGVLSGAAAAVVLRHGEFARPHAQIFALHALVFALFHFSECFVLGLANRDDLRPDSFLLNHSREYWIAYAGACVEFALEAYFLPGANYFHLLQFITMFYYS